jgi:hypothetical protein
MEEENKQTNETPKTSTLIDNANASAKRLEDANKKQEELLNRQEELMARQRLGGTTENSPAPEKKELTAREYSDLVVQGKIKHD